jgi:hypothetical protein
MKQNRVAGGTYLNYKRHDFWLPFVRDRRLRADTTTSAIEDYERPLPFRFPQMRLCHRLKNDEEINYFLHCFAKRCKKVKNSEEIIYFLHGFLFSSSFSLFYLLFSLGFSVKKAFQKTNHFVIPEQLCHLSSASEPPLLPSISHRET